MHCAAGDSESDELSNEDEVQEDDPFKVGDLVRVWWAPPQVETEGFIDGEIQKITPCTYQIYYPGDSTVATHRKGSRWTIEKRQSQRPNDSDSDDDVPLLALTRAHT